MSVSPFPTVVTRAHWRGLTLLLFCLLAGAGCAARDRSAAVLTATATPTFTPAATAILTPTSAAQVEGVYADLAAHHHGRYRLQRHGDRVEATFMTTRSPVQAGTQLPPPVLFTLPPAFRPPFPVLRRGVGQPVRADGSPDPTRPAPRPFRLQLEPDGRVRYLDPPDVAELSYLAYDLRLAWGTTPAANDRAILRILDRPRFEDLPDGYHQQSWRMGGGDRGRARDQIAPHRFQGRDPAGAGSADSAEDSDACPPANQVGERGSVVGPDPTRVGPAGEPDTSGSAR